MTKSSTITLVILLSTFSSYAQTEDETLTWLNAKNVVNPLYFRSSNGRDNESDNENVAINFTSAGIEFSWKYPINPHVVNQRHFKPETIMWRDIKSCNGVSGHFYINTLNSKTLFYEYGGIVPQLVKAILHMAQLNGAKLTNDDLFK